MRTWTLLLIGGTLVQIGGCASGLVPIGLSVFESVLLRDLFLRVFGP